MVTRKNRLLTDAVREVRHTFSRFLSILVLAALAVGGAGWYIKIYKPKHDLADAEDLDELTEAEEEPTVNEDDLPAPAPRIAYGDEPDEPDYPEGYGGEEE